MSEANTVVLPIEKYHFYQEMEKQKKILYNSYQYGDHSFESFQYSGDDEAIKRVIENNEKLIKAIRDLTIENEQLKKKVLMDFQIEQSSLKRDKKNFNEEVNSLKTANRRERRFFIKYGIWSHGEERIIQ